ncbi:FAD/NADP-binding domain-containing protein [Dacryopinax primogenitus]|uniref:FAD/NADP-binding domain-containing protein n=1 Tax=Dacryopinax primogenitus (strain DJM 731) TaxID=1858805 RepID=M5GGM5_DACPD|nr:FAD/NADP-binding domain-containing protein [Dacryopinax primogenitus]EJU05748.1 FAD/NADP-binding domain-containing protein [Dacryopinax primogenitus]
MLRIVVVGAGPAGLVTCKHLLDASSDDFPFDPIVLEQKDEIGGTFRYRSYENANLVSSKQLTCFSDWRMPLDHHDHLSLEEYVDYLKSYAQHFKVLERIKTGCRVTRISRGVNGKGHLVEYIRKSPDGAWGTTVESIMTDYLAICTGLHVIPSIPSIPGIEHVLKKNENNGERKFEATVFHSSEYKLRAQLTGRRVMILGCGETGMDLAYEAAKAKAKQVVLCHRDGFLSFPKVVNDFTLFGMTFKGNLPIDGLITNLFETAYVHPWIAQRRIRWHVSDFVIKRVLWLLTGTQAGCNQWAGELPPERLGRAYVFLNKSHKAMPYINRPYRHRTWLLQLISHYEEDPADMPPNTDFVVDLAPFPSHFLPTGQAVFPVNWRKESKRIQNVEVKPDMIIYATGYTQNFNWFEPGQGYAGVGEQDVREIFKSGDESVAYIGFVRPGVGAIPPIAEMQAMFWIAILTGKGKIPTTPAHYHLLAKKNARITYGVDHGAYMSQLARDIGAAPDIFELYRVHGSHVFWSYVFGAAFVSYYRLLGPFPSPKAPEIARTELWETIVRRGVGGNLFMGLIPMVFYGCVSCTAWTIESVWRLLHMQMPRFS